LNHLQTKYTTTNIPNYFGLERDFTMAKTSMLIALVVLLTSSRGEAFSTKTARIGTHFLPETSRIQCRRRTAELTTSSGCPRLISHGGVALRVSTTAPDGDASFYSHKLSPKRNRQPPLTPAQKETIRKEYHVPSVKNVLAFAVPAVGVWLCVPLLSMITTSCVGLIAGTSQQAALNPAIAVINYSAKAMVSGGTTPLVAYLTVRMTHLTFWLSSSLVSRFSSREPPQ
jgi:hypothetical protein